MSSLALERIKTDLDHGHIVVGDGAMGTEIEHKGLRLPRGDADIWSSQALLSDKGVKIVENVHIEHILAGARFLTTDTFTTHRLESHVAEIITGNALDAAKRATDRAIDGNNVAIAGSVGTVGNCYDPTDKRSRTELEARHYPHAVRLFANGNGADFFLAETMNNVEETGIALGSAKAAGFGTLAVSFCTAPGGRKLIGGQESLEAAVEKAMEYAPLFIAVNCVEITTATNTLRHLLKDLKVPVPVGAYPQGGHDLSNPRNDMSAEDYGNDLHEIFKLWAEMGAQVLAVCCGGRPKDIQRLSGYVQAVRPDRAT